MLLHLWGRVSRAVNLLISLAENPGCCREKHAGEEGSHGLCVRRVEKKESLFQTNIVEQKSKSQCLQRSP